MVFSFFFNQQFATIGNIKISRIDIERKTKFNRDKSIRVLNMLIEKNIIAKSGSGRATKYYLLKGHQ